jgi:predicted  nucleic acid-binding Zn-ribbon protein
VRTWHEDSVTIGVMASAGGSEARVAALEIQADATREAINALGEKVAGHRQETREQFAEVHNEFTAVRSEISELRRETRANFRSVEEHFAEIRDLIINGRGRR